MANELASSPTQHLDIDEGDGALGFEHLESFNLLCAGESGLGKSTLLRNLFSHLDPTKQHELRRQVAETHDLFREKEDAITRNEQESRQCDDENEHRRLELHRLKTDLKRERDAALQAYHAAQHELKAHRDSVLRLRAELHCLEASLRELREQRAAEADDDSVVELIGGEVLQLLAVTKSLKEALAAELCRSNLDREESTSRQTTEVTARLITGLPLLDHYGRPRRDGLDITLLDTPGYGDLVVDTPSNSSADKVVDEVTRRISAHLGKDRATRPGMSLDDERKYWNELVHLCLFFVSPHRMKRADITLMRRLHKLVPLVVVIAKSDTMTAAETRDYKDQVRTILEQEGIEVFTFGAGAIKDVEDSHKRSDPDFEPLYGGSTRTLPWAVMGSDELRREYLWGAAITSEPRHSELPAVRDLLLTAGGWKKLKEAAAMKTDEERERRQQEQEREQTPTHVGLKRSVLKSLGAGPRLLLARGALGVLLALVALLVQWSARASTVQQGVRRQLLECELSVSNLEGGLYQCSGARNALQADLETLHAKLNTQELDCAHSTASFEDDLHQCSGVRKALQADFDTLRTKLDQQELDCTRSVAYLTDDLHECSGLRKQLQASLDTCLDTPRCEESPSPQPHRTWW